MKQKHEHPKKGKGAKGANDKSATGKNQGAKDSNRSKKRKTDNFNKFFHKKSNAAVKEEIRQEKKAVKRERKEAIERHFEEKRNARAQGGGFENSREARKADRFQKHDPTRKGDSFRKPEEDRSEGRNENRSDRNEGKFRKPEPGRNDRKFQKPGRPASDGSERRERPERPFKPGGRPERPERTERTPERSGPPSRSAGPIKKQFSGNKSDKPRHTERPGGHPERKQANTERGGANNNNDSSLIPLNKYIAHSGICSRRDAAELIKQGKVQVNGKLVTEPGTKVSPNDEVNVTGKKATISKNFVYILLNKPKDYITTTEDPEGRRTVLDLIRRATTERVYPIGRLDRNTSGVLLLTNDGELAQKLAHPKHEVKKIYHVTLDKPLTRADFDKIIGDGVILEDGLATVDVLAYADPKDKTQIGLEIHSGRNRIVRRIFEHLGYDVRGLDRVMYAGLTKKNVQRGEWRLLNDKEVRILKFLNSGVKTKGNKTAVSNDAGFDNFSDDFSEEQESAFYPEEPRKAGPAKAGSWDAGSKAKDHAAGKQGFAPRGKGGKGRPETRAAEDPSIGFADKSGRTPGGKPGDKPRRPKGKSTVSKAGGTGYRPRRKG